MKLGILAFARSTFDVDFAADRLAAMLAVLDRTGHDIMGPRDLLFDGEATASAMALLAAKGVDQVLVLQITFTDAVMIAKVAKDFTQPLSIWAVPEPRVGGRLRLNAFCGLNLASHALGLRGRSFGWLYADPDGDVGPALERMLAGQRPSGRLDPGPADGKPTERARALVDALSGRRIARIGANPDGFDTCLYDPDRLRALAGVEVEQINLDALFANARALPEDAASGPRATAAAVLSGLDDVDAEELDRSLRLKTALDHLRRDGNFDAFAVRCWPETFTEYGGAVCGPVGMLGQERVPCACEADVYGALTQLVLAAAVDAPVFLADLVDIDEDDNTGVVWHCGQAPAEMRDPDVAATATIHTNRRMPLLYEFPLKPGRVTFARISQAFGTPSMVLAGGEMLQRPMAYTGTSGVVRFDRPAGEVMNDVIASGLEHHTALAYGEVRPFLREVAAAMNLPVLEL